MSPFKTNGSVPSLPPPQPKSPPHYPDLYGKRRELARVQMLEREINFLQEELKSVERIPPASKSCKEVADFVTGNVDPLIPTIKKTRKSCRFWKWLCGACCFDVSGVCCCSCSCRMPRCCECMTKCNCCSNPCGNCRIPKCGCFFPCFPSQCCKKWKCSVKKWWCCCCCCGGGGGGGDGMAKCPSCPSCSCTGCTCNPKCPNLNICSCCYKSCCFPCYYCI